ncbi:MAG TPA: SPOR domain-containing protein [Microvirga sp.]|jgi:hypothetical protein|nr:SPOR domain-containing protein [Microvirga sp.]
MSNAIKPRFSVDLDEIERQLNYASQAPVAPARPEPIRPTVVPAAAPGRNDPLAELARIVGQDDPFGNLFANDKPAPARPKVPSYDDIFAPRTEAAPAAPPAEAGAEIATGDYRERMAQDLDRYRAAQPQAAQPYEAAYDQDYDSDDAEPAGLRGAPVQAPRRSRKALYAVASVVGAATIGVGAALTLGSGGTRLSGGEPPLVQASADPVKVAPQSPGGVEIPNQNKQIYERAAQEAKTRVVNREEQPVDLRQATRMVPPSPDTTATVAPNAPAQGAGALGLGEPKRVRTVTIRPDGTVVGAPPAPTAAAAPPVMTLPTVAARPAPVPAALPQAAAATPATPAPRPAAATPSAPNGGASPQAAAPATPSQAPAAPTAPQRVAAVGPASVPAAVAPAAAPEAPVGGYSVQIGVRPSESEAKSAFAQMQQKYSELGGQPALIRKAEVNGNTLYRVRVGPMSREEASSLCSKLQGSGGQCFVAKN